MTRYFFDVVDQARSENDSVGTPLNDPEEAYRWAQLLAVVLQVGNDKEELVGGRIRVRGPDGPELFSIPIGRIEAQSETRSVSSGELQEGDMKSLVVKRSIMIGGRNSSVSLEEAFWKALKEIASDRQLSMSELVDDINATRHHSNLSSAIRLFVLDYYRGKIGASGVLGFAAETTQTSPPDAETPKTSKPL